MEQKQQRKWVLFGIVALLAVIVVSRVANVLPSAHPAPPKNYGPDVCPAAWEGNEYDRTEFKGKMFEITLHERCFGQVVRLPKAWKAWNWEVEDSGMAGDCWWAIWPARQQRQGPVTCGPGYVGKQRTIEARALRLEGREGLKMKFFDSDW
jgi:hypothetical protein